MTNEEFFNAVKGKKIRWVYADGEKKEPIVFQEWESKEDGEFIDTKGTSWAVMGGFDKRDNPGYWELVEDPKEDNVIVKGGETSTFTLSKPFWMVFVSGGKMPQCKHETPEAATLEAERLARVSNQEVALIECKSVRTCKVSKKVEWSE
jgi:hypothetical protein